MGGTLTAIENGFLQGEIQNAAYEYQTGRSKKNEAVVVGVNDFSTRRLRRQRLRIDPELEQQQVERVARTFALHAMQLPTERVLDAAGSCGGTKT